MIQAVVLAERDGLDDPNQYGDLPLVDKDPTQPDEAYFEHVDYIVEKANMFGLVIGMLPTWGSYLKTGRQNTILTPENVRVFG